MLHQLLQRVDGGEHGRILVALDAGGVAHIFDAGVGGAVIFEAGRVDEGLELGEQRVGHLEALGVGRRGVVGDLVGEVVDPVVSHNIIKETVALGEGHFHIGGDAAAVTHLAADAGVEDIRERVGRARHRAVGVAVAVVDGLDETTRGDVVAAGGHLHQRIVGQRAHALHEALAERAFADDDGAVEVLHGAGENLGGGGCVVVDEHNEGQLRVDGIRGGLVGLRGLRVAVAHGHDVRAAGHEVRGQGHGAVQDAAAVVAQVDDEALEIAGVAHAVKSFAEVGGGVLVEGRHADVADAVRAGQEAGVGHGGDFDRLTRDGVVEDRVGAGGEPAAAHFHLDVSAGLTAQPRRHVGDFHVLGDGSAVNLQEDVAVADARLAGRRTPSRLGELHDGVAAHNSRADAAVFARGDGVDFVLLLLAVILGVGVDVAEHGVDGHADVLLGVKRVHIAGVQLLVDFVERGEAALDVGFAGFGKGHGAAAGEGGEGGEDAYL